MRSTNIDWRLIVGLIFLFLILFSRSPQTDIIALALGAGWFINSGVSTLRSSGNVLGSSKVTYWRGERVVVRQPARARFRAVSATQTLGALLYIAMGAGMAYAALRVFMLIVT